MKNLFSPLCSLVAMVACAFTLGSCNRSEYAMLPQSSSYLGAHRSVAVAPAQAPAAAAATPAPEAAPVAAAPAAEAPSVAPAPGPAVAKAAAAPKASKEAATEADAVAALPAAAATAAQASEAPAKMTRVQKLVAGKVMRKLTKTMQSTQFSEKMEVAKTQKISGNLRLGIILMVVGAVVALLPGLFRLLGLIIFIVGVLFLLLALLDMA